MSRYSRAHRDNASFAIVVLVGAVAWTHRAELVHIAYIAFGVMVCLLLIRICWKVISTRAYLRHQVVDAMDGIEFEKYVADLLKRNGFHGVRLTEQYDYGVDIIAEKDGVRWGIQTKRYSGLVGADAIRQVVTGLRIYNCDQSMVITNSTYNEFAKKLAAGNGCILIGRDGLKQLSQSTINFNRGAIL